MTATDDLRATVDTARIATHSPDCWKWHRDCALLMACDEIDRLTAEVDRMRMECRQWRQAVDMATRRAVAAEDRLERLVALHYPVDEEVEVWDDDPMHDRRFPECDSEGCRGHGVTSQVCAECGHTYDDERVVYRPWPCPTYRAARGDR